MQADQEVPMFLEAFSLLAQSVTTFWVAMASFGFFKWMFLMWVIYWVFCRPRRRWRRRGYCGWGCGCGSGCGCSCCDCDCSCGAGAKASDEEKSD